MSEQTVVSKQQSLVAELSAMGDWKARYRRIIQIGKALPEMPAELRVDKYKVKGCQSQVWLLASTDSAGNMVLQADSDAAIVRGLVAILVDVYSGHPPSEVLSTPPEFVDKLGLSNNISQTRANGLSAMIKQIKMYAAAFHALQQTQGT